MSKETTMINIRGVCLYLVGTAKCFSSAMFLQHQKSMDHPDQAEAVAESCIKNCDVLLAEIRKERRKLVRARYELRKERENGDGRIGQ